MPFAGLDENREGPSVENHYMSSTLQCWFDLAMAEVGQPLNEQHRCAEQAWTWRSRLTFMV